MNFPQMDIINIIMTNNASQNENIGGGLLSEDRIYQSQSQEWYVGPKCEDILWFGVR